MKIHLLQPSPVVEGKLSWYIDDVGDILIGVRERGQAIGSLVGLCLTRDDAQAMILALTDALRAPRTEPTP